MSFGIAILGTGKAARIHTARLRKLDGVSRFYGSRDGARADAMNRAAGGAGSFASYAAAIAAPRVHAVVIGTPPSLHRELALEALAAGKHVVVEKPPFYSTADVDAVADAARAADRRVLIAENYYYKPMAEALREVLTRGDLGDPRLLSVNALKQQKIAGDWRGEAGGGGALLEGGIHWVNFMANLGLEVRGVSAVRCGPGNAAGDLTSVSLWEYAGGAAGVLSYSWEIGSPLKGLRLSALYGTHGTATWETNGIFLLVRGRRLRLGAPNVADIAGYAGMWRDFVPALRENREPRFTLDMARRDLELVEALQASMAAGLPHPTPAVV
jgi:predicted dehydrogenase